VIHSHALPECPQCGLAIRQAERVGCSAVVEPCGHVIAAEVLCPAHVEASIGQELVGDGGRRELALSGRFDHWIGKAVENIDDWGVQEEETLLLAMQEELGELTQAYLEARAEGLDPHRIDEEIDDLGALLLQLCESRSFRTPYDDESVSRGEQL